MRTFDEYRRIMELWERGETQSEIERQTGIPRLTVRDCIKRYGSVAGLYEQQKRATKATPDRVLERICTPENSEVQQAYSYLLGIYLGDGDISKVRNVYRIRVALDNRYPDIIATCGNAIKIILPDNKIGIVQCVGCVNVSCFYKHWPALLPQHGSGLKHLRQIKLENWQQKIIDIYPLEFFRGLYHSDGSRFSNIVNGKDYPRYQFTNMSDDILKLYCDVCDRLGLKWTPKIRYGRITDIYISKRLDVEYLDALIGPKS